MKRQIIEVNINELDENQLEQLAEMIYENAKAVANNTAEEMKKVLQINNRIAYIKGYICEEKEYER